MNGVAAIYSDDLARKAGWVLVHSIWEGGLLAAVFGVARIATRRGSANLRYAVACVMLVLMMASPVATVLCTGSSVQNQQRTFSSATSATGTSPQTPWRDTPAAAGPQTSYFFRCSQFIEPALPWMAQLWLVGVVLLSARWWAGTRWLRRVRRGSTAVI
ncbi:MAG TPA: hypothetical protein VKY92_22705, partial [Verrucomicrobiae bacterium]|nr:hypothetical protein [Verrucomicrobiae bacterium]